MRTNFILKTLISVSTLLLITLISISSAEEVTVTRVVDGDTIYAGSRKIRFIGVDTPELRPKQPFGQEAKVFVEKIIVKNKSKVRLATDGSKVDRYKRELRHVYVGETLIAEELLLNGLAKKQLQYSYSKKMKERFTEAESKAKVKRLGIWK